MSNKIIKRSLGTLLALTALSGAILSAPQASADTSATANVSLTVLSVCSITATPDSITKLITTYPGNSNIGTSTIKAVCNDPAGLAVYAVGYTNDSYGNTNLTSTVGASSIDIYTHVTPSGTPSASEWNMTLAAISGNYTPTIATGFDSAHEIPSAYTKVAYRNTMTDMGTNANGAKFTADFNAYITEGQAAGTYNGKVKFLLVHPNTNIVAPETLYTMQNVTQWGRNVNPGETVYAVDERDGEEYTVARLADGNLWMTKNLRLNIETANITAQNTDNPSSDFITAASSKPTSSNNWCNDTTDSTCVDHIYYNTDNLGDRTVDSDGHTYDEQGVYYNWYAATAGNGTFSTPASTTASGSLCPSGWHLPSGTDTSAGAPWLWTGEFWALDAGINGLTLGELTINNYVSLMSSDNGARFKAAPNNFLKNGMWYPSDNTVHYRDSNGYYWASSTTSTHNNISIMVTSDTGVTAGYASTDRTYGTAVRCVANQIYLQDVADWGSDVALGETFEAIDKRDGQTYKVKRLKMNAAGTETALWMSNLNLGAKSLTVTKLDNTNTHLASGVSAILASTFNTWIKSSGTGSYTDPELFPITASNSSTGSATDSYGNKYGTLYNYAAASAGTYVYDEYEGTGDATSDLCPSGWRMPTGGATGELQALVDSYDIYHESFNLEWNEGGFISIQQTLGFPLSGTVYIGAPYDQGSGGNYLSSTNSYYSYSKYMYGLAFYDDVIYPTSYQDRYFGSSIRCIAQ